MHQGFRSLSLKEMKKKSIMSTEGKKGEELVKKQLREKTLEKKSLEVKLQKFQNKNTQKTIEYAGGSPWGSLDLILRIEVTWISNSV